MDESREKTVKHESFGVVTLCRQTGHQPLFQSDLLHSHVIALSISHADERYDEFGNSSAWMETPPIIEVVFSETQFARLITSIGMGAGVPCTIKRKGEERIADPPESDRAGWIEEKACEGIDKKTEIVQAVVDQIDSFIGDRKRPTLKELAKIRRDLCGILEAVRSTADFYKDQFREQMEEMVLAAKAEIEGHVSIAASNAGIESPSTEMTKRITKE